MFLRALFFSSIGVFLYAVVILGQVTYLAPFKRIILARYGQEMALYVVLLVANLVAAVIFIERRFLLKDTGQKLAHLDKELQIGEHTLSDALAKKKAGQ
jgi:hypothetical protein